MLKLALNARYQRRRSAFLFAVFLVFLASAMGLVDLSGLATGELTLNQHALAGVTGGGIYGQPDFIAFVAIGLALALMLPVLPPIWASLLTLVAMVPPFLVALLVPVPPPLVPMEFTLIAILVLFAGNVLLGYFIETQQRQALLDTFGQYVPPALAAEIGRRPERFSMAGEARDMTVLFCDIKRFSGISEELEADALAELLNVYLTAMTDVLHAHGATIDKYIGDAIMAFWGAPVAQADHAARAVAAALNMQRRMQDVRDTCAARGWPRLEIGIGIASGRMSVGNMGSRYRVAYTVIGDAVNLAARLEALTRLYRRDILISEATREHCARRCREIDHVRVKGKDQATRLFEPLADGADIQLEDEHTALAAYYRGDWITARATFARLREATPENAWYGVMRERMDGPSPPSGWDGSVSFGAELGYRFHVGDAPGGAGTAVSPD